MTNRRTRTCALGAALLSALVAIAAVALWFIERRSSDEESTARAWDQARVDIDAVTSVLGRQPDLTAVCTDDSDDDGWASWRSPTGRLTEEGREVSHLLERKGWQLADSSPSDATYTKAIAGVTASAHILLAQPTSSSSTQSVVIHLAATACPDTSIFAP